MRLKEANIKYIITIVLVLIFSVPLDTQEKVSSLNSDELFQLARSTAFAGGRE